MQPLEISSQAKFENLLIATDFTPAAETALLYALGIARRQKARVFIVHVVNPPAQRLWGQDAVQRAVDDAWRQAHTMMTDQLIEGRLEGVENHVVVVPGDVWQEISKLIEKFKIDLIVTGTRGRTGVWKMLMGSVAEKIFRQAPCPVITVGPGAPPMPQAEGPKRILYPVGFSPQARRAGVYALSLAQRQQAYLSLLHVVKDVNPDTPQRRAELEQEAVQNIRSLLPPNFDLQSEPELFVRFGEMPEHILKLAEEWRPDLIVMGVRKPEKQTRRDAWANAYYVATTAACPVLTVRTPE